MKVYVQVKTGMDLPPREIVADIYHRVCRRAGAYSDMFYGIYTQLKQSRGFEMPKGQAARFVGRLPCFEISTNQKGGVECFHSDKS